MYYTSLGLTATEPHSSDVVGALTITGNHNHANVPIAWFTRYHDKKTLSNGIVRHTHTHACGFCWGRRGANHGGVTTECTYNSSDRCRDCNTPRNGDVNGDGSRTLADLNMIISIISGSLIPTAQQFYAADIDGNGIVNITDATHLQMFLAGVPSIID